tara:strand:+ start:11415 stop:13229 length:1815 start_codon:yes stop_codon:yes gene_type:complete
MATLLWDIPVIVALKFLGVPDDDISVLQQYGVAHKVNTWGRPSPEEQQHVATNVGKFWHYSGDVLERMKRNTDGQSGWMYDMIRKNQTNPRVVTDNYLHSMMMAILVAAHETTATATANAIKHLLSKPKLWQKLHHQPELIPAAVEECLRYAGPIVSWRREATQNVQINGVNIAKGDKLFLVMAAANRDPEQFENPEELDILRDNASEHLSFGYGAHQCLGRNIGRLEMCAFIEELTRRIPDMTLSKQTFTATPNTSFHGPEALWVEWNPEAIKGTETASVFAIGNPDKRTIVRQAKVVAIHTVATDIKEIVLASEDDTLAFPHWTPGAHIELHLPNGLNRKYSLCPSVNTANYSIMVKQEPEGKGGSMWIHQNLKLGDKLPIQGPKNFFPLQSHAQPVLLIAGGIGITPMLSMAEQLTRENKAFRLLYCGRTRDSMVQNHQLKKYEQNIELFISSEGKRLNLDAELKTSPPGTPIYTCGPEGLIHEIQVLAERYHHILSSELFTSQSNTLNPEKEHAFDVELVDTGKTYHVPRDKTLLEVMLDNNVDVPNDCAEGLCGSCEVIVLGGGEINHRDHVLSVKERQSNKRMMTCCSRASGKITIKL